MGIANEQGEAHESDMKVPDVTMGWQNDHMRYNYQADEWQASDGGIKEMGVTMK